MNIDAKAREIADAWLDEAKQVGIDDATHSGLASEIATALLSVRNETLEEAAKVAAAIRNSEFEMPAARQAAMTIEDRIRALTQEGT